VTSSEPVLPFDVVVVGSGAAGMTAALTAAHHGLNVVVTEKADVFGGSTARSGGNVWVPDNHVLHAAGVPDSAALAEAYLEHVTAGYGGAVEAARRRAVLRSGPPMLAFVEAHTPLRFAWVPGYSDYYPEAPGGLACGRTVEPRPLDGRVLGPELDRLIPPYAGAPGGIVITARDYRWLSLGRRHPRSAAAAARVTARWLVARARRQRLLSMGQALTAGLRAGLRRAGVPVWLNTPMVGLLTEEVAGEPAAGGTAEAGVRVVGVRVASHGEQVQLRARRGVVLACGGFEHNEAMRRAYQAEPTGTDWTVGAASNTGDGIVAGGTAGAALDLMDEAWWGPAVPLGGGPYFCLAERTLPGCLIVNGAGRRYVNEAGPYVDVVHTMYERHSDAAPHVPSWLIADQRYRDRYLFGTLPPGKEIPRSWYRSGAVHRAGSLADLAEAVDVPPAALHATVERFNGFARTGVDEDFHRGDSAYDRYYGDPRNGPNPCLGVIAKPPFYAVRLVPGDLGTKGGLRTDEHARVLRADGSMVPGLYAVGNVSSAVMGRSYAGAGATLGPAMTFGYLAGVDLAREQATSVSVGEAR
jgi:3-oxosteroid 1-dehydrogenase